MSLQKAMGSYILTSGAAILAILAHNTAGTAGNPERLALFMLLGFMISSGSFMIFWPSAKG